MIDKTQCEPVPAYLWMHGISQGARNSCLWISTLAAAPRYVRNRVRSGLVMRDRSCEPSHALSDCHATSRLVNPQTCSHIMTAVGPDPAERCSAKIRQLPAVNGNISTELEGDPWRRFGGFALLKTLDDYPSRRTHLCHKMEAIVRSPNTM